MPTDEVHGSSDLREAVRRYLRERPDAADTVAGIAQWWLPAEMRGAPTPQLRQALADLIAAGEVRCTVLPDGSELYARGTEGPSRPNERDE